KRVLGKMLFWDEQLSSDNTVACGTCHRPGAGGSDPRVARHPGVDGVFMTPDDIIGSPGIARADSFGNPVADPLFGFDVPVTRRAAPTWLLAPWSRELFWDGRATSQFTDPSGGGVLIASGGALESQSVAPIMNDAEMAYELRTWGDVTGKLASVTPLALA